MPVPLEFVTIGRPATVNRSSTIAPWAKKVMASAKKALREKHKPNPLPAPHLSNTMVKVFLFPPVGEIYADTDNSIKPTIDALKGLVMEDDKTVQRVVAQRFIPKHGTSMLVSGSVAKTLLLAISIQNGLTREFATAVKVERFRKDGGPWW